MTEQKAMTEEEQQQWVRDQYLNGTKYLASKGLVSETVTVEDSRYLTPVLSIWKLKLLDKTKVWVISGDLPSDHSNSDVAPNAREAIRHFALKWQMQAENLLRAESEDQTKFANLLIGRAEGLYQLYEKEDLWK